MTKAALMARFDDWVTDPEDQRAASRRSSPIAKHIGERYLGRYVVWKSSGSTGEPGIYVQDADALATFDALMAVHLGAARFAGERSVAARRQRRPRRAGRRDRRSLRQHRVVAAAVPGAARGSRRAAFSILDPLPRLVAELNAYQPAFLASYPTMLSLLADEQAAGRLTIGPRACGRAANACRPARRRPSSAPSAAASSTNTARRSA